jgi:hypothetical protein
MLDRQAGPAGVEGRFRGATLLDAEADRRRAGPRLHRAIFHQLSDHPGRAEFGHRQGRLALIEAAIIAELGEHPFDLLEVLLHELQVLQQVGVIPRDRLVDHAE